MKTARRNQSVEKMLAIIEAMAAARGPMRLQDIAAAAEIPPSTALRFLVTLMTQDYAYQDPGSLRYGLTLKVCAISERVKDQVSLRDVVRPHLVELAERCRESTCLAIERDDSVVYVDVAEGPDSMLRTLQRIGHRAPLHSTGVGKVLLADWPEDRVQKLVADRGLEQLTPRTLATLPRLTAELVRVRELGYAVDDEECEAGVRCVAAPLRDFTDRVIASLSVTGPATRMDDAALERVRDELMGTAREISRLLGWRSGEPVAAAVSLTRGRRER
jgi:DNA-binding IclR family transcriptional regulator